MTTLDELQPLFARVDKCIANPRLRVSTNDAKAMRKALEAAARENERLREALQAFLTWGAQQCPCENEEPNPCPLCFASVENLEVCKAVEAKFPRHILDAARNALSGGPHE